MSQDYDPDRSASLAARHFYDIATRKIDPRHIVDPASALEPRKRLESPSYDASRERQSLFCVVLLLAASLVAFIVALAAYASWMGRNV